MIANLMTASALALALTGVAGAQSETAAAYDVQKCANIGNSFEAPRDASWGGEFHLSELALIKQVGFDTIRLPVRWSEYVGEGPDFTIDPTFFNEITGVIDEAMRLELNVVLNVHHYEEIMHETISELPKFVRMWQQIATRYADYPDSLWFEVLNEPKDSLRGEALINAQAAASLAIRETNPDRIIILMGEDWSGIDSLDTNMAPFDDNFVYSFHYYDPFRFTHQHASWVPESANWPKRSWGSGSDRRELREAVANAVTFEEEIGHPVYLGEFGVNSPVDHADRVRWTGEVASAMEEAGIGWCLWAFSNTFALYDRETGFDEDMLEALGLEPPQ
jgi:endoglucanase